MLTLQQIYDEERAKRGLPPAVPDDRFQAREARVAFIRRARDMGHYSSVIARFLKVDDSAVRKLWQ